MIAKALGAGGGWSGKVEYLYEGKLEERQVKDKLAEVILHSDNVRVPYEYSDKVGRQRMKADFIAQAQSHKWASKKDKTIGEHVLSFTAEDMRVLGNKSGMRQVAGEYVKMLGLDKTQHVAILHKDTDNPHLHIVFNRVTDDGKKYKDSHERRRALAASVALSQKHGLSLVGNLKPAAQDHRTKAMRAGMEDLKALQAKRPILSQARNLLHLSKLADKQGLAFEDKGDRITLDSQKYKLSDLNAMFQANRDAAATAKKAAAKKAESPAPAQDVKQQPLRAQEREELFRALSMGHLAAKAERMGIAVQKGREHITLNGERHLTKDIEQKVARNFERSTETRREESNRIDLKPTSGKVAQQNQKAIQDKADIAAIERQKQPIVHRLEEARIERSSLAERDAKERQQAKQVSPNQEPKESVKAVRPQSVQYHITPPNQDGTFKLSSTSSSYKEGASVYELENIGGNKYQVYVSEQPYARKMIGNYGSAVTVLPVFEEISAFNRDAKSLQTVKPALMQLENGVFRLLEKGELDYDKVGIERENAKQQAAEPVPDQKVDTGREETTRLIAEKDSEIEKLTRQLKELEVAVAQRKEKATEKEPELMLQAPTLPVIASGPQQGVAPDPAQNAAMTGVLAQAREIQIPANEMTPLQPSQSGKPVETPPILDYAISRWQLAELAQKTETVYQKHDDRSVSVGGQTLNAATLDARLEENRGRYEQMRYLEIQQSLGEQMAQARSRAELAHLAKLQGEKSAFKPDLTLKDRAGKVRHFDGRDVDTILGDNLKNSATPSHQLLGGAGATITNLGHVKMIAREFGMRLTEADHSITTVDRKGNAEAFDKKEVLAMLDVNQAIKIAELRAKYGFLDKVESFKEFEEQAQENKQDYKAIQASDAAQALRTGQETVKVGKAMMKTGAEQLDKADEMVTAGQVIGREGKRMTGEGKQERGERALDLGVFTVKTGAKMAVEAEKAVNEGALTLQIGKTLIHKVEALGKEALKNYEQAPWEKPPVQKTTIAVEAQKPPTAGEKILAALRGGAQEKGPVKGVDTDYIISERTRFIKLPGGEELHRAEMRKIIEENKIDRAKRFDQTHQSLRLLRESTSFGDLMRRAKETETKVEVKGRYVEIQGVWETTKVRMSDLQDMMYLNRTNHKGQEHDHRQATEPEVGSEGGKQAQDRPQQAERMVSMKAGYAKEDKKPYRGNRRREGKKTPDYELKLGKIKLSTDKSKRMKL